jgi:hypothetical protein
LQDEILGGGHPKAPKRLRGHGHETASPQFLAIKRRSPGHEHVNFDHRLVVENVEGLAGKDGLDRRRARHVETDRLQRVEERIGGVRADLHDEIEVVGGPWLAEDRATHGSPDRI